MWLRLTLVTIETNVIPTFVLSSTISDILRVFSPYPYSTLISGVFPLDQIADVRVSPSINLKLISHEITFKLFQHMSKVTDRQMDG